MKQIEIVTNEIRETEEDLFKVHLYLEGDWWRAYEWSAYLCEHFPNNLDKSERLKITHRPLKDTDNGIIMVGLKLSSFDKYLPNISQTNGIVQIDNKHMVLDVKETYRDSISFNDYKRIFLDWKNNIPYKENASCNKTSTNITYSEKKQNNASLIAIMQQVLGYPLEKKTLIENTLFISELKEELSKII